MQQIKDARVFILHFFVFHSKLKQCSKENVVNSITEFTNTSCKVSKVRGFSNNCFLPNSFLLYNSTLPMLYLDCRSTVHHLGSLLVSVWL